VKDLFDLPEVLPVYLFKFYSKAVRVVFNFFFFKKKANLPQQEI
jgi:hypothetical protein